MNNNWSNDIHTVKEAGLFSKLISCMIMAYIPLLISSHLVRIMMQTRKLAILSLPVYLQLFMLLLCQGRWYTHFYFNFAGHCNRAQNTMTIHCLVSNCSVFFYLTLQCYIISEFSPTCHGLCIAYNSSIPLCKLHCVSSTL